MSVEVSWKEDVERISKEYNGKLVAELYMHGDGIEEWQNIYSEANIEAPDNLGFTPLMFAAQRNMLDMLEILIEWNANPDTQNDTGKTALMFASFKGNLECMETLLESGAEVRMTDQNGLTALHMATDGEQTRAIKLLVKFGADVEARDSSMGWTPLLRCAGLKNNGNFDVACELIRLGSIVDALDNDGKTPLHNSIINCHQPLCRLLLSYGASVDLITKNGYNALQLAESVGNAVSCSIYHLNDNLLLQKILQVFKDHSPKQQGDDN
ncbi:Fibronectin type 3 and ankyrin repeat domains protein 1 [Fasciolopsis buskii]|uniref:Fibronectin type 3 and ankyrin repeat domains protein 1 n=1 Tax=Fasciolopsis buskii TaxID=27845 RepID=A0A8E0RXJ8_9TREM|nr:Fibronectin type 3 and ankyrin repeat domains protein 1 [Fasciolopsis buski]